MQEGQRYDIVGIFFFGERNFTVLTPGADCGLKCESESACLIYMVMTCQRPRGKRCAAAESSPSTKHGRLHEWQSGQGGPGGVVRRRRGVSEKRTSAVLCKLVLHIKHQGGNASLEN